MERAANSLALHLQSRKPAHRAASLALAAMLSLTSAASVAQDSDGPDPVETPDPIETPAPVETYVDADELSATPVSFDAAFEGVVEPIDRANIDPVIPADAVNLDTFEAPVEESVVARDLGTGVASYYGRRFHGRLTANGERFNMRAMTAAHRTLPFGSIVRVTNPRNGRSVTVRINDRGPFIRGRSIDLSRAAAEQIGMIARGHAQVEMELLAP